MLAKRIIPCLDVTAGRVVKGVNFVNLRDAGDPVELAARYNVQGIPNFAVFNGGKLQFQQAGLVDANTMKSWLAPAA